jgi:hypothetical protein
VEYEENCPFPYNNFIYKIELATPATGQTFAGSSQAKPYTSLPPEDGVSILIFRLSNPVALGLNNSNRLENEVASMFLARQALAAQVPVYTDLIPAIYAWKAGSYPSPADETGFAWALMEFRGGVPLDSLFGSMLLDEKKAAVEQIADVFSAIQKMELLQGVASYGGLDFDVQGKVVVGQMTTLKGGPWSDYAELWAARLGGQVEESEGSSCLRGWKENGVRERIGKFLDDGVAKVLRAADIDTSRLVLVHGDLSELTELSRFYSFSDQTV